jgi:hypothetical protein
MQSNTIEQYINPDYSPYTELHFTTRDNKQLIGENNDQLTGVFAGVAVTSIDIVVQLSGAVWGVNGAYLKIVSADVTSSGAKAGECSSQAKDSDVVNSPWETSTGAATLPTIGQNTNTLSVNSDAAPHLTFRKGGLYKVCYSNLGTFDTGPADPLNIEVVVAGLYTDCSTDNCLATKVNYCYALKLRGSVKGSCVLDYSDPDNYGNGLGYYPENGQPTGTDLGRASWSSEFIVEEGQMDSSGKVLSVKAQPCATEPNARICPSGEGCSGSARYFTPESVVLENKFQLTYPPTVGTLEKDSYVAFTVAACYCPGYDFGGIDGQCNENQDFVQQVGIIHFFATKGCHIDDTNCLTDVSGIMPQYEFKIWVLCPTDACPLDGTRVKFAPSSEANDRPWWDNNGCAGSVETPLLIEPGNCYSPNNCTVEGGMRQDYKSFGSKGNAFLLKNGVSNYEIRNFHKSVEFDVCFCLENCGLDAASWMKVGIFRFASLRLTSAATDTADKPTLEYVNFPGTVAFHRDAMDADVLGLQDGGVIKILLDNERKMGDKECGEVNYDNALVEGLTATTAGSDYRAKASEEHSRLVFNNGNPARTLTVKDPGIIALCYCAITSDSICADQSYWKLVTHLTMKGPNPSQSWTFSTNVVFRFSYTGWGLSRGDTLRIIETDAKCTDNEGNPNQADTSIYYNCPDQPTQVSNVPGKEWNFPTSLLSSESVRCNRVGFCEYVFIQSATVIDEHTTELLFTGDPTLLTGDYITIGNQVHDRVGDAAPDIHKNIQCDQDCTPEQEAEVMGVYHYADGELGTNDRSLPDTYFLGHVVTKVEDGTNRRYRINVGWKNPPTFKTTPPGAQWIRRNVASTHEEILGVKEKSNLKVCWSFGGNGKYVTEVGRINLRDPTQMQNTRINLSTKAQTDTNGVKAPVIISFQTTTSAAGQIYSKATGSMQLKLVFTSTEFFDGLFTDGSELNTAEEEDEVEEATQSVCGRLFLETWSDDMTNGFPMPKGCYYRVIQQTSGRVPEIGVVFEEKNGLRQGYNYQIVMMGVAKHKLRAEDPDAENTYLEIYSMDDVKTNPYGAVELGLAKLSSGIGRVPGNADPQFGARGFTLIGGYDSLVELDADTPILFELRGGNGITSGRITPGAHLRIFLYPFTQWTTGISCDARCVQSDENPFNCGTMESCVGAAIVEGFQNNFIKMRLPDDMEDLFAERKHTISVGGLTLPSGAVFPSKLAAELTSSSDTMPDYTTSVGDLIWKGPGKGRILARLVNVVGDGNTKPFRGDNGNVLYMQIMFAGLLKAHREGSAYFTVQLPPGYVISEVGTAPSSLYVFGDEIPQGRGSLDPSGWSIAVNKLTYTFPANFVIFSGSSLYIKVVVDNPHDAFKDVDPLNVWTLQMHSSGEGPDVKATEPSSFIGVADGYASNAAVLGKLHDMVIQPVSYLPSTLKEPQTQLLQIFFRSEQQVGSHGSVMVFAPPIFHFATECDARDMDDLVYSTRPLTVAGDSIAYRLPTISGCFGRSTPENPDIQHNAQVYVEGRMTANTLFAFQLQVTNPTLQEVFDAEAHGKISFHAHHALDGHDWRLVTMNMDEMAVDGSYDSVQTFPGAQGGIGGIYKAEFQPNDVSIEVDSMYPYSLSRASSLVTVKFQLPPNVNYIVQGAMRISAPTGFIWESLGSGLQDMPGIRGFKDAGRRLLAGDKVEDNFLLFASRPYYPFTQYGFKLPVKVPDLTSTMSSNGFFLEIGYDHPEMAGREIAGYTPAKQVQALLNPRVRYTYNVEGKENNMIFEIQLITMIPSEGALKIEVPEGYRFSSKCRPMRLAAYKENFLPDSHDCRYDESDDERVASAITITPGAEGMVAKFYVFTLVGQNPAGTSLLQTDVLAACGFTVCWPFLTVADMSAPTVIDLDRRTYAYGFSINRKMIQARLPLISDSVRKGTGRNDRPNEQNQLIFAFSLNADVLEEYTLTLRGPYGFGFHEDCTDYIVTREDEVFGEGNKWPPEYDPWELGAKILSCAGHGTNAHIRIAPGLMGEKKYAFRIGVAHNPPRTPEDNNQWVVDYAGETSEPFDGFVLWTFTEYSLIPISRAQSQGGVDVDSVGNAVSLTFKPHNMVHAAENGASYRLTLPEDFAILHVNFECPFVFESLEYDLDGITQPGETFDSFDINCKVDPVHRYVATNRLAEDMIIYNDRRYRMTLEVYNPTMTTKERMEKMMTQQMWMLESYAFPRPDEEHARDAISIPSYDITPVLSKWTYINLSPKGKPQVNGLTEVKDLQLLMQFPDSLKTGDKIQIQAPPKFRLEDDYGRCNEARGVPNSIGQNLLENSPASCSGGKMEIMVMEVSPEVRYTLQYQVSTVNPPENVPDMENYWRVEHVSRTGEEMSSHVFKGWVIIPQLESVMVSLLGPYTAAGSADGVIEFSFRAVSKADTFLIVALAPVDFEGNNGFDFTLSRTRDEKQEVFRAEGPECEVIADIPKFAVVSVILERVQLALGGGETMFDLSTYTGGYKAGDKQDEKESFTDGFRLPGSLEVTYSMLKSTYSLKPEKYPIQSMWNVRLGEQAQAEFRFFLSIAVPKGKIFHVNSGIYMMKEEGLQIMDLSAPGIVPTTMWRLVGNDLRVILGEDLRPDIMYSLRMMTVAPLDVSRGNGVFLIECIDDEAQPIATNDALTPGFALVVEMDFKVFVERSPPATFIPLKLEIDPKGSFPTELQVYAPPDFNFTADCLISGPKEVISCQPKKAVEGRETAVIVLSEDGLVGPPDNLRIKVMTPNETPSNREWLLEGIFTVSDTQVGWGAHSEGIRVNQMRDTEVMYSGATGTYTEFAVKFYNALQLGAGGMLEVIHPVQFKFFCDAFNQVSIPGEVACETNEESFRLAFNHTVPPGDYSFSIMVEIPQDIPEVREFSVLLYDRHGDVQDAAMNVPGPEVKDNLVIFVPDKQVGFKWIPHTIVAGAVQLVEFTLQFDQDVPDDPEDPPVIGEILFTLPTGFVHDIRTINDFQQGSTEIWEPPSGPQVDYTQLDRVRFAVDNGQLSEDPTRAKIIKKAAYQFRFPVIVPMIMPTTNIWVVSVCGIGGGCSSPNDQDVLLNFPLAGFQIGEIHPLTQQQRVSSALGGLAVLAWLFSMI